MGVSVQGDGRILVTQYLRQCFDIHPAFDCSGCKCMAEGMKTTPFYVQFLLEQFKTALIGAHRNRSSFLCNDKLRLPVFLQCSQNGHELLRYGDLSDRVTRFWGFGKTYVISVFIVSVVTRFGYGNGILREINIPPFEGKQFSDSQTGIQADDDSHQLGFLTVQYGCFQSLLFLQ